MSSSRWSEPPNGCEDVALARATGARVATAITLTHRWNPEDLGALVSSTYALNLSNTARAARCCGTD